MPKNGIIVMKQVSCTHIIYEIFYFPTQSPRKVTKINRENFFLTTNIFLRTKLAFKFWVYYESIVANLPHLLLCSSNAHTHTHTKLYVKLLIGKIKIRPNENKLDYPHTREYRTKKKSKIKIKKTLTIRNTLQWIKLKKFSTQKKTDEKPLQKKANHIYIYSPRQQTNGLTYYITLCLMQNRFIRAIHGLFILCVCLLCNFLLILEYYSILEYHEARRALMEFNKVFFDKKMLCIVC